MNLIRCRRHIVSTLAIISAVGAGIVVYIFLSRSISENAHFDAYTSVLFNQSVSSSTLSTHYMLSDPARLGIKSSSVRLYSEDASAADAKAYYENIIDTLTSYDYGHLSAENQLTYDILNLYAQTELSCPDEPYSEPLSPTLGIHAQLPILFAEYAFRTRSDIDEYLILLSQTDAYLSSLLSYEEEKADAGYFMTSDSARQVVSQCLDFVTDSKTHFLTTSFHERLLDFDGLSDEQINTYMETHRDILVNHVFSGYMQLASGMEALAERGVNHNGLCYYRTGRDYYTYLVRQSTGIYESIPAVCSHLAEVLQDDYRQLIALANSVEQTGVIFDDPDAMIEDLRNNCLKDFPPCADIICEVKQVPDTLAPYVSPAFYLTPPIDTCTPNIIYINPTANDSGVQLYTTLAHEGFPGHLYQTCYFTKTNPPLIRHTLGMGGYVEGWATYVEQYACNYLGSRTAQIYSLTRSINLCLMSIIDISVHYYGWTKDRVATFLAPFGITEDAPIDAIFSDVLENPANCLKYCLGSLAFESLLEKNRSELGSTFDMADFHKKILEIGPCQFPILYTYMDRATKAS